jgi:outer membrane lipoprotein LolB
MQWSSIKRYGAWCCVCLAAVVLAACAAPPRIPGGQPGHAFERTGRFALNVTRSNGGPQAVQGGFAWRDTGTQLRLDLANPLGSTLARVEVVPGAAMLTREDGSRKQAPDPDALVELVLGSPIPVANLRDWLQGRTGRMPVQGLEKNPAGQIAGFEQNGWNVQLSRYDALGPKLLQLHRDGAGERISVRLVIDSQ